MDNRLTGLPLPAGLADREEMAFLDLSGPLCRLRRADGAEFTLDAKQVHFPCELQVNGEWLPETHPDVIQSMRQYMEKIRSNPGRRTIEEIEEILDDMEWIIRRNSG